MRKRSSVLGGLAAAALIAAALVPLATPAQAATLTEVTNFGTNPSGLRMHIYVPDRLAARPPILVAVHYCTGSGPAFFNGSGREFATLADQYGYIVIYPSATRSGNCFDVYTQEALRHNGGSDPVGIVSMVNWALQRYNGDPNRVYATGASSGGMMTNVLLGAYPDVFRAGAAYMGVPFACFATTPPNTWNSECANGQIVRTAQQWGDLVRNAFPGYSGPRPRMQTWHGTADSTLRYPNFGEQIKQWTNVHGLSQTPSLTDSPASGWTRTRYGGTGTTVAVEAISLANVGHSLPMSGMAAFTIRFLGLDTTLPPTSSPPTSGPPPTTTPPPPPGTCRVAYTISPWGTGSNGFTAGLTLTNTGTSAVTWTLRFTLPTGQALTLPGWGATYTPSGSTISAVGLDWNRTLQPGQGTQLGFNGTHTGNTSEPTTFTVNNTACAVG